VRVGTSPWRHATCRAIGTRSIDPPNWVACIYGKCGKRMVGTDSRLRRHDLDSVNEALVLLNNVSFFGDSVSDPSSRHIDY
jgi:hypothetical protein